MNLIKNIEIKNFKSIRHQKIDDCRRVNVFVGYPNTGKSNILEAISLFGASDQVQLRDLIRVKEIPTIFFNGFIEEDLMVSLNNSYGVFGSFSKDHFALQLQENITLGSGSFKKSRPDTVSTEQIAKIFEYKDFESKAAAIRGRGRVPEQFAVRKYEFNKSVRFQPGSYSALNYPFGENIFSILQTNKDLQKDVAELFETYNLEFLYDSREQRFTILKRSGSVIFTVPYELLADTLQRLIFYKAAIASNKEKKLLFEEPEAHMFPPYISKFTADIIYDKNDNQFFINTHSPFVINDLMENLQKGELSIYVVGYKKEIGETVLRRLTDEEVHEIYQYGVDLYMNLENFLVHERQ